MSLSHTVLLKSEWLDQKSMNDPMIGRIVILRWFNKDMKTFQLSVNEEWFEGSPEDGENAPTPNYHYGHYFNGETKITQKILAYFYERSSKLFSIHRN